MFRRFNVGGQALSLRVGCGQCGVAFGQLGYLLLQEVVLSFKLFYLHEVTSVLVEGGLGGGAVEAVLEAGVEGVEEGKERWV